MVWMWTYIDNIRYNQSIMISVLLNLDCWTVPQAKWGTYAILLKSIENAIQLPLEEASIPLLYQLSERITRFPGEYYKFTSEESLNQYEAQITAFLFHGERVRNIIMTKLAASTVYGRLNSRLIYCVRASSGTKPASNYFPMYID